MMLSLQTVLYSGAIGLMVIGLAGVLLSSHLFRTILALSIAEAGVSLMLILAGFRPDAAAPILLDMTAAAAPHAWVDPVPQAMVLTAIVIGVGIQALALALAIGVYRHYGTLNVAEVKEKMVRELNQQQQLVQVEESLHAPEGSRPLPVVMRGER